MRNDDYAANAFMIFTWVFSLELSLVRNELCREKRIVCFSFGYYFKYMGGNLAGSSGGMNKVDSIAAIFSRRKFSFAVAPRRTQ
jgi:hypothetical protein